MKTAKDKKRERDWVRRGILNESGQPFTIDDYKRLFKGCCDICGTRKAGKRIKNFVVEHNHTTGIVRGIT